MKTIGLRAHFPLTLLAASLASTPCVVLAQQAPLVHDTSEVCVMVRDSGGQPVRDATVVMHVMQRGSEQGDMEVRTDQEGKIEQDIIPIGNLVKLEILAPGFQTYKTDYQVNALVKNLVVRLKQQAVPQNVAARPQLEQVAKNTPPPQYREAQWVTSGGAAAAKKNQTGKRVRKQAANPVK